MGKKNGSAPKPPDPQATAAAEAQYNRLDTYGPSGSGVQYGYTNDKGNFVQGQAPDGQQSAVRYIESDTERQIRETLEPASVALTGRIVDDNITNMPDAARVADRGDVAADIFNRNLSMMQPQMDKADNRLMNNLQARGIPIGSEAFNDAYGEQQRQTMDTLSRMTMDANIAAGSEQSRQFGLDQAQRGGAIAELVAAMGGGYNPPNPTPSGNAPGINYSGLVNNNYAQELGQYQQNQAMMMDTAKSIGALGAGLVKSTRQSKDVFGLMDIHRAAATVASLPLHAWRYKPHEAPLGDHGGHHVGPMAEDFHQLTGLGEPQNINVTDYFGILIGALQSTLHRVAELEREFQDFVAFEEGEAPVIKERLH